MKKSVLLVCTGNTCRSPMAEFLLRHEVAKRLGISEADVEGVGSAGLSALSGCAAAANTISVVASHGCDPEVADAFRSRNTSQIKELPDIALCMEAWHAEALREAWGDKGVQVFLVRKDNRDVSDPVGCSEAVYDDTRKELVAAIAEWIPLILGTDAGGES